MNRLTYRTVVALMASSCLLLMAVSVQAQPGGGGGRRGGGGFGGPQMSPEQAAKVYDAQAKTVAKQLSLSDEETGKLAAAYKAARESYAAEMRKLREEAAGGGGNPMARLELTGSERAKLETALKEFLSGEKLDKAMASLGTFNNQGDAAVNALLEMNLEPEKLDKTLVIVDGYTAASGKAMDDAIAAMDFQSLRASNQELRAKLETDLATVLTAEQLEEFKSKTARRGGRGGGQGGPGGGGRRGPGGPPSN